jgi:hypothetical protein
MPGGAIRKNSGMANFRLYGVVRTHDHCGALTGAIRVENDWYARRVVAFQVLENQRDIVLVVQVAHQRLQFIIAPAASQRSIDSPELTGFLQALQKCAQISEWHRDRTLFIMVSNDSCIIAIMRFPITLFNKDGDYSIRR